MTVSEMITLINLESNEILDDGSEYIPYINAAIDYLSMILIAAKDNEMIKAMDVSDRDPVPSDFVSFIPKHGYPLMIVNGSFNTYDSRPVKGVFYATKRNHIGGMDDAVPFSELYVSFIVQLVSFLVKKKSLMIDFASFDKTFIADLTQAIQTAKGG